MALIICPECGREISNKAPQCIHCGYPLTDNPINKEVVSSQTNNKRNIAILFVAIILVSSLLVVFFISSPKNTVEETLPVEVPVASPTPTIKPATSTDPPAKQTKQPTLNHSLSDEEVSFLVGETDDSLVLYLDVLGNDIPTGDSISVSEEFLEGFSSVKIMGYVGTVAHRYNIVDNPIIDIMDWCSNDEVAEDEFYSFTSLMSRYFGSEPTLEFYDEIQSEAYIWTDNSNFCTVLGWYANGKINLTWVLEKNRVNSSEYESKNSDDTSDEKTITSSPEPTNKPISTPAPTIAPKNYCIECGKEANYTYTNPFSNEIEDYCYTHYKAITDTISKMEEDVGKSNYSKHTCEECSREGTHTYHSFTGQTEYYCSTHYKELKAMLEAFGLD